MKYMSRHKLIGVMGVMLAALCFGSWIDHRTVVDMPVSLAEGTVRTPEFPVKHEPYLIIIRAEKRHLPFADMNCMMGLTLGPVDPNNCDKEPLLQAEWTVWADGQVVAQGSVHGNDGGGGWANDRIDRYLGHFMGERKKKYVLEVKFTKDGTALNVTHPHLVVTNDQYNL